MPAGELLPTGSAARTVMRTRALSAKNYVNAGEKQFQLRPGQFSHAFAEQIPIQR
jgi:hypothetical protein